MIVDLHCHSCFSDGVLTPEALVQQAELAGVQILALTDHDTTAGLALLQAAARNASLTAINGIELSASWKKYVIHVIGLNILPDTQELVDLIALQNQHRILRAQQISERLVAIGVNDAYQKACKIAGHERVGRPHFAQVLIQEGLAPDMQTAFKRFLVLGRQAYVPTLWANIDVVVACIVRAGGQAIIAHPLKYKLTRSKLFELINSFKLAGGAGIEVISGEMTVTHIAELAGICQRFDLLASSGSDFHSDVASRIKLGRQRQLPVNCVPIWQQWT